MCLFSLENGLRHPLPLKQQPAGDTLTTSFLQMARKYNTVPMLWDSGADFLDRAAHIWRDQVAINILMNGTAGVANSLPDSTENGTATRQRTGAYIFHQVGTAVTDQTLPFLLNGNTLKSISSPSKKLTANIDYIVGGSNITFKASLLSAFVSSTTTPGSTVNLTLTFSAGANLLFNIVQWDVLVLGSTSAAVSGSDLSIPITWKGIGKPAAVRALESNGTYLEDTWIVYSGPSASCKFTGAEFLFVSTH